jgi:hypothetical protein
VLFKSIVGIAAPNKEVLFIAFCLLVINLVFDPDLPSLGVYCCPLRTYLGDLMEVRIGFKFSSELSLTFASSFSTINSDYTTLDAVMGGNDSCM